MTHQPISRLRAFAACFPTSPFPHFPIFPLLLFLASCSGSYPDPRPGTIMFTSDLDCEIRLFTIDSIQIARGYFEPGKPPFIVPMKEPGEYILIADALEPLPDFEPARKNVEKKIIYRNGNLEYYIEFY